MEPGQNRYNFGLAKFKYKSKKDLSFSIYYSTPEGTEMALCLVVEPKDNFDYLLRTFSTLFQQTRNKRLMETSDFRYIKDMWSRGDQDRSGGLTVDEVVNLVAAMNINQSTIHTRKSFKTFDFDHNGVLDFKEFTSFIELLRERFVNVFNNSFSVYIVVSYRHDLKKLWRALWLGMTLVGDDVFNVICALKTGSEFDGNALTAVKFIEFW